MTERPHPIVVTYSELNLLMHEAAQRRILEELGIKAEVYSDIEILDDTQSAHRNLLAGQANERNDSRNQIGMSESRALPRTSSLHRLPSTKSLLTLRTQYLTKWIGLAPLENHPTEPHAFCIAPKTAPLSAIPNTFKPKERLISPLYLSEEFIRTRYNNNRFMQHEAVFKSTLKPNDRRELVLIDKKILEAQKGILSDVIKQASFLLLTGQGMVRMSLPIRIFDAKSQTERIAEFFTNLDSLHRASDCLPGLEMFKHVIAFFCGNYLYGVDARKPFNPYIGETLQARFAEGTRLFIEHIHHDPPIDSLLMINEHKGFRLSASLETVPNLSSNEMKLAFRGIITVTVHEEVFHITLPLVVNKGLVFGTRRMALDDCLYFYYPTQQLKAFVEFGSEQRADKLDGSIFPAHETPAFKPMIFGSSLFPSLKPKRLASQGPICAISGFWTERAEFDGQVYWSNEERGYKMQMDEDVLPSDWRFREDLLWLLYGNSQYAQDWKLKLEEVQREWRKIREANAKQLKKKGK